MYNFTDITRLLIEGREQLLEGMKPVESSDTILIYDPIIGEDWIKPFMRDGKKDVHGLMLPVKSLRKKHNDEALPAPVVVICYIKPHMSLVYNFALYYDMNMQEILVRSGAYLSKDRDWHTDDTLKHTLLSFDPKHQYDHDYRYIKRYADREGEPLYGNAGYTDMIVPTSETIINV